MFYLIFSVLTSTMLIVGFRLFEKYRIHTLTAISVNYLVATLFGFLNTPTNFTITALPHKPWFGAALVLGITLIVAFHLFAQSARRAGVVITAISSRMSVVIPVTLGFLLFREPAGGLKLLGIGSALVAFYLTFKKDKIQVNRRYAYLPLFLLLAVGANDSWMKISEHYFIGNEFVLFLSTAFGVSFILGSIILLIRREKQQKGMFAKNLLAGVLMGLLNWFSTLYFLRCLDLYELSVVVPVVNVSIVTLSTLAGYALFRERLSWINLAGVGLAVVSIVLLAL